MPATRIGRCAVCTSESWTGWESSSIGSVTPTRGWQICRPLKQQQANRNQKHIVPIIMCTRSLWEAIGGRGSLPQRRPTDALSSRLAVWSAHDVSTDAGRVVVALEESTYLTIVCRLWGMPDFGRVFAASVGAVLDDLGIPTGLIHLEVCRIVEGVSF